MATPIASQGIVRQRVQNAPILPDNQPADVRLGARGDPFLLSPLNGLQAAGAERSYYTFTQEGTRGTGVNLTVATGTSYANTQALMVVYNNNPVGGPDIILDYLTIKIDTVITGGTAWHLYHAMDQVNRYASGPALMTGYNCDGSQPPGVFAYTGVVTAAAPVNAHDVGWNIIANGVLVANAFVTVKFGRLENPPAGTFTIPTTAVAQSTFDAPPVVIPPGWSYVLNEFQAGRSGTGVGEFFLGAIVR